MNDMRLPELPEPPEGYVYNSYGGLSVEARLPAAMKLEDQMVRTLIGRAVALREQMAAFRTQAFNDVDGLLALLCEKYGAKRGGQSGNTTMVSIDGRMRVQVSTGDFITFGPELQVAKSLVDECLMRWTEGSNEEIKAIVTDAFDVGKEGKIRTDRVLGLRRLEIEDAVWKQAMQAIGDAVRTTHSRRYVRFHVRETHDGAWKQVPLDLSQVA